MKEAYAVVGSLPFKNWYDILAIGTVKFPEKPSVDDVLIGVCNHYKITRAELISKNRKTELVEGRVMVSAYLYNDLKMTYKAVGEILGGRDHTTALNSVSNHHDWMIVDKDYRASYKAVIQSVEGFVKP